MPSLDDGGPEVRRDASLPAPLAVQPAHPCAVVRATRSHPVRLPDSRSQRPRLRCDIRVAISHFTGDVERVWLRPDSWIPIAYSIYTECLVFSSLPSTYAFGSAILGIAYSPLAGIVTRLHPASGVCPAQVGRRRLSF